MSPQQSRNANFTATRWNLVQAAARPDDARGAMEWLCERYWFPLFGACAGIVFCETEAKK